MPVVDAPTNINESHPISDESQVGLKYNLRDYDETFAPVAHMTTVCTLIAVGASSYWTISQMDV